jgi:sulfotransferase family protein
MTLPTFVGIGVPRGGTTWLHTLLAGHPDVYMPTRRKEIRFFDRHYERGLEWYESFFCPPSERGRYRAIGEISPQYLYCQACPERIASSLPDAKLVVTLRHPVERAYSQYGFVVQRRNYRGTFEDFLAERPSALERGFYSRHIRNYLRVFERSRLLPLVFEDVFADLDAARRRVAGFLHVDAEGFDAAAGEKKVNASTVPRHGRASGVAVTVGRRLRRWKLEPLVDLGRRAGVQQAIARGTTLPALDDETKQELSERYAEEFEELESCLGIDLSRWRP